MTRFLKTRAMKSRKKILLYLIVYILFNAPFNLAETGVQKCLLAEEGLPYSTTLTAPETSSKMYFKKENEVLFECESTKCTSIHASKQVKLTVTTKDKSLYFNLEINFVLESDTGNYSLEASSYSTSKNYFMLIFELRVYATINSNCSTKWLSNGLKVKCKIQKSLQETMMDVIINNENKKSICSFTNGSQSMDNWLTCDYTIFRSHIFDGHNTLTILVYPNIYGFPNDRKYKQVMDFLYTTPMIAIQECTALPTAKKITCTYQRLDESSAPARIVSNILSLEQNETHITLESSHRIQNIKLWAVNEFGVNSNIETYSLLPNNDVNSTTSKFENKGLLIAVLITVVILILFNTIYWAKKLLAKEFSCSKKNNDDNFDQGKPKNKLREQVENDFQSKEHIKHRKVNDKSTSLSTTINLLDDTHLTFRVKTSKPRGVSAVRNLRFRGRTRKQEWASAVRNLRFRGRTRKQERASDDERDTTKKDMKEQTYTTDDQLDSTKKHIKEQLYRKDDIYPWLRWMISTPGGVSDDEQDATKKDMKEQTYTTDDEQDTMKKDIMEQPYTTVVRNLRFHGRTRKQEWASDDEQDKTKKDMKEQPYTRDYKNITYRLKTSKLEVVPDDTNLTFRVKKSKPGGVSGNHEAEIYYGGEADLQKHVADCKKNPGHKGFIPLKDFNINCLPSRYCEDELMFKTIKTLAALTVQVKAKFTSLDRPEFYPDSQVPYPCYNDRGSHVMRLGTGRVWSVDKDKESDRWGTCRCAKCLVSATPSKVWGEVRVLTASHVVFDDSEARQTSCVLGFDDNKSPVVSLDGWEVLDGTDIEGDVCWLRYVTCDLELVDELDKMWRRFDILCKKVRNKYGRFADVDKLTVIVSHPHGCPKQVSIGQWTHKHMRDGKYTRYWYTTCTCTGSAGAYVYMPGCKPLYSSHVHSGSNSEGNYSGESYDFIFVRHSFT